MEKFPSDIRNEKETEEKPEFIEGGPLIFRVRHGSTNYVEQTLKGTRTDGLDLTPEGIAEINNVAEKISPFLKKERDIVCVIAGPRERTVNGKRIIEKNLSEKGFQIILGEGAIKGRQDRPQHKVGSYTFFGDDGRVVNVGTQEHADIWERAEEALNFDIPGGEERMFNHELDFIESTADLESRSKRQMERLVRICHSVQESLDKEGKRLVIIQIEHGETLDNLFREASKGERSRAKNAGPKKGEVAMVGVSRQSKRTPEEGVRVTLLGDREDTGKIINLKKII